MEISETDSPKTLVQWDEMSLSDAFVAVKTDLRDSASHDLRKFTGRQLRRRPEWVSMEIADGLQNAVNSLYRSFAKYSRPAWFMGCACCWNSAGLDPGDRSHTNGDTRIVAPGDDRPLRELTADGLRELAQNVPHLGGDTDVLRHYLPRLLEIVVTTGFNWPDLEVVFSRLAFGPDKGSSPWWTWPQADQDAINLFLTEAWASRLRQPIEVPGDDFDADSLLCGIGLVVDDVTPYLAKWLDFDEPYSAQHLESFLDSNMNLPNGQLANAFWQPDDMRVAANMRAIVRWAHSLHTQIRIVEAAEKPASEAVLHSLQHCFDTMTGDDSWGEGQLERAIRANDVDRVRSLLANGVDPNEVDDLFGIPIWEEAFRKGQHAITRLFARAGANVDRVDDRGQTLLHRVVRQGPDSIDVQHVLQLGPAVDVSDRWGWTPLHSAACFGYTSIVRELLRAGANPNALTRDGKTPLDLARTNGHDAVVKTLTSAFPSGSRH